jgi:hypothetical protein
MKESALVKKQNNASAEHASDPGRAEDPGQPRPVQSGSFAAKAAVAPAQPIDRRV